MKKKKIIVTTGHTQPNENIHKPLTPKLLLTDYIQNTEINT